MTFHSWVFRRWVLLRWVFLGWVLRRWVFEVYCREYPTRNLELGIPDVGHSRRWVFQMLGIPYENQEKLCYHNPRAQWKNRDRLINDNEDIKTFVLILYTFYKYNL